MRWIYVYIYLHDQMKHGVANLIRALGVLVGVEQRVREY
jgi:hypothetical protein